MLKGLIIGVGRLGCSRGIHNPKVKRWRGGDVILPIEPDGHAEVSGCAGGAGSRDQITALDSSANARSAPAEFSQEAFLGSAGPFVFSVSRAHPIQVLAEVVRGGEPALVDIDMLPDAIQRKGVV